LVDSQVLKRATGPRADDSAQVIENKVTEFIARYEESGLEESPCERILGRTAQEDYVIVYFTRQTGAKERSKW